MATREAFVAGTTGGVVMTMVEWAARTFLGTTLNLEAIWGTMFLPNSQNGWLLGLIVHLLVSGIVGLIYAACFEFVVHHASAALGAAFSLLHALVVGTLLGMLSRVHPRIPMDRHSRNEPRTAMVADLEDARDMSSRVAA